MKTRKVIALLLPLFVIGLLFSLDAQNITVTKPVAGSHFCNWGNNLGPKITWTKSGAMNGQVRIDLFDSTGNSKVWEIAASTPNNGDYSWTYNHGSTSILPGSYTIRVTTLDNQVSGKSAVFVMEACNDSGPMSFIAPQNGDKLRKGSTYKIRWQVTNPPPYNYFHRIARLTLVPVGEYPTGPYGNVGRPPLEQKEFDWFIPVSTPVGHYQLWLFTEIGSQSAHVDDFIIEHAILAKENIDWSNLLKILSTLRWIEVNTPGVRELDLSELQATISQGKEKVHVDLMNGTQLIADLGQFGPGAAVRTRQRIQFPTSQGNGLPKVKPRLTSKAEEYQLRIKNMSGELLHTHPVKLEKTGG